MLLELHIENFLLIVEEKVSFLPGFNVLSGETGAGKSIIIDALSLALGSKSNKNFVRRGKDKADIQATFLIEENDRIKGMLTEHGINTEDDLLILNREIFGTGKSISRINGRIIPLSFIKQIGNQLLDIHGQHEHQSLLYSENHLNMLDLYGSKDIERALKDVAVKFDRLSEIKSMLNSLDVDFKERERKIDLLKFQINEIEAAKLQDNEDEEVTRNFELLKNSKDIYGIVYESQKALTSDYEDNPSILNLISDVNTKLNEVSKYDKKLEVFAQELNEVYFRLEDISTELRHYGEGLTFHEQLLVEYEDRLDIINNLKRKYGNNIIDINDYCESLKKQLNDLENSAQRIEDLQKEYSEIEEQYLVNAEKLSEARGIKALELQKLLMDELKDLNFNNAEFKIQFAKSSSYHKNGIDDIEFLISTNPGELLKPLAKIASGGEISRIMLAIKRILADLDAIPTLIFDEIDTGISGLTANIVGEKIAMIAKTHQTLCITHLPQIAVMADHHLFIEKTVVDGTTITTIDALDDQHKKMEISRLIGGSKITDLTIKAAEEMLDIAAKRKKLF